MAEEPPRVLTRVKGLDKPAQLFVHRGNLGAIRLARVAAAKRLGRFVGRMGVEVMHPDEQRLLPDACARCASARSVVDRDDRSALPAAISSSYIEPASDAERFASTKAETKAAVW